MEDWIINTWTFFFYYLSLSQREIFPFMYTISVFVIDFWPYVGILFPFPMTYQLDEYQNSFDSLLLLRAKFVPRREMSETVFVDE